MNMQNKNKFILIINGPNLNMLGMREKEIYGTESLKNIENQSKSLGKELGLSVECIQSNNEADLINFIQGANQKYAGIIINAGAFTHTSIAIRDALSIFQGKKVEIHMSNVHKREKFRHVSMLSDVCDGTIIGFGKNSYLLGLHAISNLI